MEKDNQQEGQCRKNNPLAKNTDEDGFWMAEHLDEGAGLYAKGNTIHDNGQGDVQQFHSGPVKVDLYGIKIQKFFVHNDNLTAIS